MPVPGEVTRHVPGQKAEASRTELITFAIGDEQYGVDIMSVREIKGWTDITHLPKQPDYVRGVLNLRGVMVPIIDLRCRLGEGLTDATPLHVVIIVQVGDQPDRPAGRSRARHRRLRGDAGAAGAAVARNNGIDFLSGLVTPRRA